MSDDLETRAASTRDLPAILELLQLSMARADDTRFESLFLWKHVDNRFGPSPMWIACDGDRVVGLRTFMRWEFECDGAAVRSVRAVDTATHPDYQGRGIFKRLTLDALPVMAEDGVQFVFNTPNSQSRPGYLKMGWHEIGRAVACVRPLSVPGAARLVRSRVPAAHWSEPGRFGVPVEDVLADSRFAQLVASQRSSPGRFRTRGDVAFLTWRYGTPLLGYRVVVARGGIEAGVAFVRVRRRGRAREAVLAGLLAPGSARDSKRDLLRSVVRNLRGEADYLLGVGKVPGCVPMPSFGPVMTTRSLAADAPDAVASFDLTLGDLELF